jgi:hypothetical protein
MLTQPSRHHPPLLALVDYAAAEKFHTPPLRSWERWRLAGHLKRSLHVR